MMLSKSVLRKLLSLFIITSTSASSITFQNRSPSPICYKVEITTGRIPTNAICDYAPGILINSTTSFNLTQNATIYRNVTLYPTWDFNGAVTAMSLNGTKGTRHEISWNGTYSANSTWYDIDYEMGISNSTLGPVDQRNLTNGLPSLQGERNALAKVNDAWFSLSDEEKLPMLPHYYYLDHRTESGNLSIIRMDKKAPFVVKEFLQLKANLSGYVGSGSVAGVIFEPESREGKLISGADKWSFVVETQDMIITAF